MKKNPKTPPQRSEPRATPLLYGLHAVRAAWLNPARLCRRLLLTEGAARGFADTLAEAQRLRLKRPEPKLAMREEIDRAVPGAVHQGIILDAAPLEDTTLEDLIIAAKESASTIVLALDQVTDPHNVGAVLRSASAFGAAGVITARHDAPDITGVLAKTASGAVEHIPYIRVANLARALETLMDENFMTIALDERGDKTLAECAPFGKTVLVMGAEGEGLRRLTLEKCQFKAKLPTGGPIGSLNVSNAAAVGLYELARSRITKS